MINHFTPKSTQNAHHGPKVTVNNFKQLHRKVIFKNFQLSGHTLVIYPQIDSETLALQYKTIKKYKWHCPTWISCLLYQWRPRGRICVVKTFLLGSVAPCKFLYSTWAFDYARYIYYHENFRVLRFSNLLAYCISINQGARGFLDSMFRKTKTWMSFLRTITYTFKLLTILSHPCITRSTTRREKNFHLR